MTPEARSLLDLTVLLVLVVSALLGTASGALRQLVSLLAALAGVLASRAFAPDVADGLARTFSPALRPIAPVFLFFGIFAVASLAGGLVLRGSGLARVVRGPIDRSTGALLGGAKGALAVWMVLSAVVLARDHLPARFAPWVQGSDFAAVARSHNLVARLDPEAARKLENLRGGESAEGLKQLEGLDPRDLKGLKEKVKAFEDGQRKRAEALDQLEKGGR